MLAVCQRHVIYRTAGGGILFASLLSAIGHLITYENRPAPARTFSQIASVDAESDTRSFLENADCAVWVRLEDPVVPSDAILALYQDRERCRRLGQNGRDFRVQFCEQRAITGRYEQLFLSVRGAMR